MLIDIILFAISLVLLVKGADYFVDSSSKIAKRIGVSELVIGLTLVSVGTSLPELGTAISAAIAKNPQLILGNIVGSNIANIALVMGFAMVLHKAEIKAKGSLKKSAVFLILSAVIFLTVSLFGVIPRLVGILFLVLFGFFIFSLKAQKDVLKEGVKEIAPKNEKNHKVWKVSLMFILSIIAIFFGAKFIIPSASSIAASLGVSDVIIGVFAIAVGTSLPELAVAITSLKKKKFGLFIGNIIGSNIANLLLIGGLSAIILPLVIDPFSLLYSIPVMVFLTLILFLMLQFKWKMKQTDGMALLGFYTIFVIVSFFLQGLI